MRHQRVQATSRNSSKEDRPLLAESANRLAPAAGGGVAIQLCGDCGKADACFLGHFSPEQFLRLQQIRQIAWYPRGARLFLQGEATRGIYVVCSGEIKTMAQSAKGDAVILRRVSQGDVLGISSSLIGKPYPVSAETLVPSQLTYIPRAEFLHFLESHPDNYRAVADTLAGQLQRSWEQSRMLALNRHVIARLAELLLDRANEHGKSGVHGMYVPFPATVEEIGESIGASRETVSRLLSDLGRQGVVRRRGGGFLLLRPKQLKALMNA